MSITIQHHSHLKHIPSHIKLTQWCKMALDQDIKNTEITLRIVNKKESAILNTQYRHKTGPTNVLSFVYSVKPVCGDIVLCAPLIKAESEWAHLVIHGVLHLRGYDHMNEKEAVKMEKRESHLLKKLGFN